MSTKKQTVSFYSQGCRLNISETATMTQQFKQAGFEVIDFKQPADIVIVNTCTVTENGDSDTRKLVNKINRLNDQVNIALVGCQAQILKDKLLKLPNVTWVVGNAQKMQLPTIINSDQHIVVDKIDAKPFTSPTTSVDLSHVRANLKIQDGCDFYCAFCIIPFARGPARSRSFDDLMADAKALVAAGHKEIVLTGINLGTYSDNTKRFIDVVDSLDQLAGLERIRISSIEPTTIPDEILERFKTSTKLCPYFHIPIQSGCDATLTRMRRKYTIEEYTAFIDKIVEVVPDACIGTDVIVGFPGETDDEFEKTKTTLANLPLAYMHVFSYSERSMAHSRKFENQVEKSTIATRAATLRQLSQRKKQDYDRQFVGQSVRVLVEQQKANGWVGHTDRFVKVWVPGGVERNEIADVAITGLTGQFATGDLIGHTKSS